MLALKCLICYACYTWVILRVIFPSHVLINDIPLMYEYCAKVKERNDKLPLVTSMWCLSMDGGMGRHPYIARGIA